VVWLAMPGFRVLSVDASQLDVVVSIETSIERLACPSCGAWSLSKGRRVVTLRDVPWGERPVTVRWRKRIGVCAEPECATRTWTEQRPELVLPGHVLTVRACRWAAARVAGLEATPASLTRVLGVTWSTVWSAVEREGVLDESRVAVRVGFDETVMSPARHGRWRRFITAAVDLDTGKIIDVFDGRAADDLHRWLADQPAAWVGSIEAVCADLHASYRAAIRRSALAEATMVVDPFHVVRAANDAVTKCRARVQRQVHGHRGRKHDPLYTIRNVLLLGAERLDGSGWERFWQALDVGDPDHELLEVWAGKELVRDIYLTDNPDEAVERFERALVWCAEPDAPTELATVGLMLRKWRAEILAHHTSRVSNGRVEAANLNIKQVKRSGRGFRNLTNYRYRILLASHHQREAPHVTRHRARPRLIA